MARDPARSLADSLEIGAEQLSRYTEPSGLPGTRPAVRDRRWTLGRIHGMLFHLACCVRHIAMAHEGGQAYEPLAAAAILITQAGRQIAAARPVMAAEPNRGSPPSATAEAGQQAVPGARDRQQGRQRGPDSRQPQMRRHTPHSGR